MAVRAPENARVLYESLRNSSVSSDSGIVLLQPYQEHLLPDYHDAENARPYHPSISPYVNSRPYVDARNENILPASNVTVNSNTNDKRMFSWVLSKLARHPWTESTEFTELWSDIPNTAARHKEQKASDGGKASTENVVSSSNYDSSRISLTLRNYPWTASTEFVVLWTDIPSELDTIQNLSDDGKWSMNQNGMDSSSNIPLATHVSDRKQDPAATSGIFNFGAKSEKLTKLSRNPPNNSISNGINSKFSKQKKAECCGQLSDCRCNIQRAAMNWRYHIILLTMKILLSLIPISAIYMGAVHIGTCPANEFATNLVYITGIAGLFLTGCHVAHHIACNFFRDWKEPLRSAVRITQNITVVLLILEMIIFYSMSPSFENSENYCDKIFYNYTFYMNFAAAGIVFLSVLLQYTSCKHQVENEAF